MCWPRFVQAVDDACLASGFSVERHAGCLGLAVEAAGDAARLFGGGGEAVERALSDVLELCRAGAPAAVNLAEPGESALWYVLTTAEAERLLRWARSPPQAPPEQPLVMAKVLGQGERPNRNHWWALLAHVVLQGACP